MAEQTVLERMVDEDRRIKDERDALILEAQRLARLLKQVTAERDDMRYAITVACRTMDDNPRDQSPLSDREIAVYHGIAHFAERKVSA